MAMTLAILHKGKQLVLIAGFENGMCSVFVLHETSHEWKTTYRSQAHSQPVLSLDTNPQGDYFISSSADALIVKHPIPTTMQTTISDATTSPAARKPASSSAAPKAAGGIGALFADEPAKAKSTGIGQTVSKAWEDPIKVVNTKHAGQQNLTVRSDGLVFATAGWDSKVRVYATKSLKELAVLKWHQVGVYATAFAQVEAGDEAEKKTADKTSTNLVPNLEGSIRTSDDTNNSLTPRSLAILDRGAMTVKDRRVHQAKHTHWLAAGAKDGKMSLWDIY